MLIYEKSSHLLSWADHVGHTVLQLYNNGINGVNNMNILYEYTHIIILAITTMNDKLTCFRTTKPNFLLPVEIEKLKVLWIL